MYFQMSFVVIFIFISIRTILTFIKIIIMNTHMSFQFCFRCKARLTIRLWAFVPKIYIRTHCMHFAVKIQVFLDNNFTLVAERCLKRSPLKNQWSHSVDQCMNIRHSYELSPYVPSIPRDWFSYKNHSRFLCNRFCFLRGDFKMNWLLDWRTYTQPRFDWLRAINSVKSILSKWQSSQSLICTRYQHLSPSIQVFWFSL